MDVLCVFNSDGKPFCTEFFVKFKSPLVDEVTIASLGLHEDAGLYSNSNRQNTHEIAEAARRAHLFGHPLVRNDNVQITCNGRICHEVKAFVGPEQMLHFYDETDNSCGTTPSSNILTKMELTLGRNEISCIHMHSALTREFSIWVYDRNDRLVVMDIDGTITKSDITGYIQTVYMGLFSYVHDGIVPFLRALHDQLNLHIIYLTARPLAHQRETKLLLEGVKDRDVDTKTTSGETGKGSVYRKLPFGPLFSNKAGLMSALYREMVLKTTQELKTGILQAISAVFRNAGSTLRTPFVLGIGNKSADAHAYNLAGMNAENILIINKSSRIEVWRNQQIALLKSQPPLPTHRGNKTSLPSGKTITPMTSSAGLDVPLLVKSNSTQLSGAGPGSSEDYLDDDLINDNNNGNNKRSVSADSPVVHVQGVSTWSSLFGGPRSAVDQATSTTTRVGSHSSAGKRGIPGVADRSGSVVDSNLDAEAGVSGSGEYESSALLLTSNRCGGVGEPSAVAVVDASAGGESHGAKVKASGDSGCIYAFQAYTDPNLLDYVRNLAHLP